MSIHEYSAPFEAAAAPLAHLPVKAEQAASSSAAPSAPSSPVRERVPEGNSKAPSWYPQDALAEFSFLSDEFYASLSVGRLNLIHKRLWFAGKPVPYRPLHRHGMMGTKLIITEQADLHMLWKGTSIFVKPLPNELLDFNFWMTIPETLAPGVINRVGSSKSKERDGSRRLLSMLGRCFS